MGNVKERAAVVIEEGPLTKVRDRTFWQRRVKGMG